MSRCLGILLTLILDGLPERWTSFCGGCVIQADDPKEAAKGILARAAARGIIAGVQEKLTAVREEHPAKKPGGGGQRKDAKRKSKKTAKPNEVHPLKKPASVGD